MTALLDPAIAVERIREACTPLPSEHVTLAAADGRVLAAAVRSAVDLPPFDNSMMDGFALGAEAPATAGSIWPIAGEQAAGDAAAVATTGAWEIMTGARVPDGRDRVIPVERAERLADPPRVRLLADVAAGTNVRTAGSDVQRGGTVLDHGTVLAAQHLMLLAALGVAAVEVAARPRVAVLCTGRELVDDPAARLESGQIRDSNGPYLAARLPHAGAEVVHREVVGDDAAAFLAAVGRARAAGAHIVLSTGAVSMGRYDFVPHALEKLGATVLFHKLAIRPGKPLLFARLPDGTLFFGLPGNPIAVAVGLRFFVSVALRALMRLPTERPLRVRLANAHGKHPDLRMHFKARLGIDADGRLQALILPGQESYRIAPYARANAWVIAPAGISQLAAGTLVDACGLSHLQGPQPAGADA